MGVETTGEQIYRHGLNKGGLDDILAQQRLLATEARSIRGGASAVRAMNGAYHLPYKGDTVAIEFTTTSRGVPQKFGGMDGTAWYMDEGEYLQIQVRRVLYPDGRVVTYPPRPTAVNPVAALEEPPPPVAEQVPPPPVPEVPTAISTGGGGEVFLSRVRAGFKAGLRGIFSIETGVMVAVEVLLFFADRAAAMDAMRRLKIFFTKEGFAKGVAAAVMRWSESELKAEAFYRVTEFRVQSFHDPANHLTLPFLLDLATKCENYAVAFGYVWASQHTDSWKKALLDKGTKRLAQLGYDNRSKPDGYFFEYEFLSRLSWALRQHLDPLVDQAAKGI